MATIDFASMTNTNNQNDNSVFLDFSNHSKISNTAIGNTPEAALKRTEMAKSEVFLKNE